MTSPPTADRALRDAIRRRATDFDVTALLDLLEHLGYARDAVVFRGNPCLAPQPSLIHAVVFLDGPADAELPDVSAVPRAGGPEQPEADITGPTEIDIDLDIDIDIDIDFDDEPWNQDGMPTLDAALDDTLVYGAGDEPTARRAAPAGGQDPEPLPPDARVLVVVNLGLASCRSPLPSYFTGLLGAMDTRDPLLELLGVLDHDLLGARLTSDHPRRTFPGWGPAQADVLALSGLASPVGLDWLFRKHFPELGVSVRRIPGEHQLLSAAARLGHAVLGRSAFGSVSAIPISDIEVTLTCAESLSPADVPWIHEAGERLRARVLPTLAASCMHLTVALLVLDQSTYARIADDSYVGYDPLRGGPEKPRRIVLFQGALTDPAPSGGASDRV